MAPDLNSLPPSRSPNASPQQPRVFTANGDSFRRQTPSPSPRSSSVSLAAAATINAGIHNQDSRRSSISSHLNRQSPQAARTERRRSNVMMNINLNDPSVPGPGELQSSELRAPVGHTFQTSSPHSIGGSPTIATGDPHHHQRAPSLGQLHQELEQEQEAQVNRLLNMIRAQQAQIQQMQLITGHIPPLAITGAVEDSTPTSERSLSFPAVPPAMPVTVINPRPRSPGPRGSYDLSRHSSRRSRTPSHQGSPSIRPVSAGLHPHSDEWMLSAGSRDESAFYQAETQMLTRENQMLRMRIRELERLLNEANTATANTPATPSNLASPPLEAEGSQAASEAPPMVEDDKT